MSVPEDPRPEGPELSRGKALAFSALILASFFALCEIGLAALGIARRSSLEDPYVGFASANPLLVESRDANGTAMLETAPGKLRFFNAQRFPAAKAPGTRRAFCIGGSTTYGRPYDDRTSFCGWLRAFLAVADRGATWEVVNAGGISYASYRAARVVEELTAHEPDLFVIYSGHNEFLERRTYSEILEMHPALLRADSLLNGTRTYSALRSLIERLRGGAAPQRSTLAAEVSTVLDQSIGPDAYSRDDAMAARVIEHYRFNLGRMLRLADDAGADALLVTPAANRKDCSPFKSEHRGDISPAERAAFREHLVRGRALLEANRLEDARRQIEAALAIDGRRADAHYALGQVSFARGDFAAADRAFRAAVDEDVCPLRALSPTREIIREVAAEHGIPHIDFPALLEEAARREHGHGIPGAEYFLDHVHPTIEANRRLALAIVDRMAELAWIEPGPGWTAAAIEEVTAEVRSRIDTHEQGIALRNLAKVLSWAGKSEDAAQLAQRALALLGDDSEIFFILGAEASERGRYREAAARYRDAIRVEPDYVKAWNNLGIALARLGEDEEAVLAYQEALNRDPDHASARFNLANALGRLGRTDAAIAHYSELLHRTPDDGDAHFNLAAAYARRGDLDAAVDHYTAVLEITPDDADALYNRASLLEELNRSGEAKADFERAAALGTDD